MTLKSFIERPVLASVISIVIVIAGIIGLASLPVEQYPDIAPPTVMVRASYPGASAETIQKSVIVPLEEAINGVEDMTYITSAAAAGSASISIYFKQGTDPDMAAVNAYLAQPAVRELFPADIIFKWGVKGDDHIDGRYFLYALKVSTPDGKAPLDGSVVTESVERYASAALGEVSMTMNAEGTQEWARLTGENVGKCIAIVLDGYVYSAPV